MGNTWEIYVWKFVGKRPAFQYVIYWQGESVFKAIYKMWRAKREGFGCVRLEWR